MPELPEVETVVKSLYPLKSQKIAKSHVFQPKLRIGSFVPDDFSARIQNAIVIDVIRVAKYILIKLSNDEVIIVHLGMSGNLLLKNKDCSPEKHDHVVIELDNYNLFYRDPRRFGLVELIKNSEIESYFKIKKIGIDALSNDFNSEYLFKKLEKKQTPIKIALLNQEIVAGLGNIYVCEALFISGIAPDKPACAISKSKLDKLVSSIKETLNKSIKVGGTTLKDYRTATGEVGYFSQKLLVYGKESEACINCETLIKRTVIGGRSTFFCPKCQK